MIILLAVCTKQIYNGSILETLKNTCITVLTSFTIIIVLEIAFRLCVLVEESCTNHLQFNGNEIAKLTNCTKIGFAIIAASIFGFLILLMTLEQCPFLHMWNFGIAAVLSAIGFSYFLLKVILLDENNTNQSVAVSAMNGLDYGTGMAYSFFYGYLKIILPSTGTASKGLLERIRHFEDDQNVTVAIKKLFILIPASSHIPPDLKEASDNWMESVKVIEEERDRAGLKSRLYRNNIYRIYPGGEDTTERPIYIVVEGATPILTFFEVQQHSHRETILYKEHRRDILSAFHEKLKELIDTNLDCRGLCELVYYEDYDRNGKKNNIGKILLERIRKLQGNET